MAKKKVLGVGVEKAGKNWITFKSKARAENYLKQMQSLKSKYSRTGYFRRGKTVIRV